MTGVGVVNGDNMAGAYGSNLYGGIGCFVAPIQRPLVGQEKGAGLQERLLSAANELLRKEGIRLPSATLEVTRNQEVVLYGAPNSGPILVCALNEGGIQNYL